MKLIHLAIHPGKINDEEKNKEILELIYAYQIKKDIPIVTIDLTPFLEQTSLLKKYAESLLKNPQIDNRKTRIFVLGNWYDLDAELVELLKQCMEKTKEYDQHFLNICLNYNGQEEIVTALKVLSKKIETEKLEAEKLTPKHVKENLATSYFPPPDVILQYGEERYSGLLLWDSMGSRIVYAGKEWDEFEEKDLETL